MRNKIIIILITLMLLGGMTVVAVAGNNGGSNGGGNNKVTLCHVPPGNPENPQEIEIDESAVSHHKNNHQRDGELLPGSDTLGPCSKSQIPEFPTIALPIAAMIGLVFFFQNRKKKEE